MMQKRNGVVAAEAKAEKHIETIFEVWKWYISSKVYFSLSSILKKFY
jgi:hypothetical protein